MIEALGQIAVLYMIGWACACAWLMSKIEWDKTSEDPVIAKFQAKHRFVWNALIGLLAAFFAVAWPIILFLKASVFVWHHLGHPGFEK